MSDGSEDPFRLSIQEVRPFIVSYIHQAYFSDTKDPVGESMESVQIIWSEDQEGAEQRARRAGAKLEHGYPNMEGRGVRWVLKGWRVFEMPDWNKDTFRLSTITDSTVELFSRFIDNKCADLLVADGYKK